MLAAVPGFRRCTGRNGQVTGFCLYPAAAFVTIRQFIQRAQPLPARHPPGNQAVEVTSIAGRSYVIWHYEGTSAPSVPAHTNWAHSMDVDVTSGGLLPA
jgi:hypothetical protein